MGNAARTILLRTMAVEEHENPLVESMEKNEPMTGGKVQTETSASIKDDDASITIDPEGVKTSNRIVDSQQSIRFSLDEAVPPGELHVPPGVDTPFTFGTFIKYFGPGWLVCIAYVDPGNFRRTSSRERPRASPRTGSSCGPSSFRGTCSTCA